MLQAVGRAADARRPRRPARGTPWARSGRPRRARRRRRSSCPCSVRSFGEGALAELDVAAARVVEPARLAERGRIGPDRRLVQRGLDLRAPSRRAAWSPWARKNLMPLSWNGVVAGADHHAQVEPLRARQVGHAGRRQRAEQQHVDAGRVEARLRAPTRACSRRCGCPCRSAPWAASSVRLSTRPTACARRSTKSGVMGGWPTVPRMPSVPKYFLLMVDCSVAVVMSPRLCSRLRAFASAPQQPARCQTVSASTVAAHVVHAHDARAALHREQRRRDAGRQALADRPAGDARRATTCATSRPAAGSPAASSSRWRASSAKFCATVLPKPMPGSTHDALGGRRRAPQQRRALAPGRRAPRPPRRPRSRRRAASSAARRACASGRRRRPGARPRPRRAPGWRSAQMSLTMSAPSVERRVHHLGLAGVDRDRHAERDAPRAAPAARAPVPRPAAPAARPGGSTRRRCRGCRRPRAAAPRSAPARRRVERARRRRRTNRA